MTHFEIRKKFLDFFQGKGHKVLPSSALVPDNDPTVLLTTAGMQQFKGYFLGERDALTEIGGRRATTIQKCFRTTDIDEVGDETHLTFFEMLGNFSFGDYFKREAIDYAWELLVKVFELSPDKLWITVFGGDAEIHEDREAREYWQTHLSDARIWNFGREANFWGPPGKTGPCGPSSEIHYEQRSEPCVKGEKCGPNCECGRFVEIWNLVFMQYFKDIAPTAPPLNLRGGGEGLQSDSQDIYTPLPKPSIDTGAGLERLAVILQNKTSVFETDLLWPLIFNLISSKKILQDRDWRPLRILADHLRASVFLIADGVRPSNLAQGYILRRLMRRAVRFAKELGLDNKFYVSLIHQTLDIFGNIYPELIKQKNEILNVWSSEEEKFRKTLEKGLQEFQRLCAQTTVRGERDLGGEAVFHLYDTYGFPLEFSLELASEAGLSIDQVGFDQEFRRHQMISRAGVEGKFGGHGLVLTGELKAGTAEEVKIVTRLHSATHLLHEALRRVLGAHVRQTGSDITPERLRFDFTHPKKLSDQEMSRVSDLVNEQIKNNLSRQVEQLPFNEAIKSGALAFFKEKYPEVVNVYSFVDPATGSGQVFSREVCGGPHVEHAGEIGKFKIIKEEAVGAGVRRIRATVEQK